MACGISCLPAGECLANTYSIAHGGFITSLTQNATREYFLLRYPSISQPDAINLQVLYIPPVPCGEVRIVVEDLKIGRKISMVRVEVQIEDEAGKFATRTISLVTQGNLAAQQGINGPISLSLKSTMPHREDCERWVPKWALEMVLVNLKLQYFIPSGGLDARWPDRFDPGVREGWVKMDEGTSFDTLSVGSLADNWFTVPTAYPAEEDQAIAGFTAFRYPTLSMTLEIKRQVKDLEWLFVRIVMRGVEDGRANTDVLIISKTGQLMAVCRLLMLVMAVASKSEDERRVIKL
jgi:acyl-coenzyme A thioesterase PaaI-like protein